MPTPTPTTLYHLYLRQPDRRLYPCVVLFDDQGLIAAHPAPLGRPVSRLTAQQIQELKTFRGAEQMKVKPVPARRVIQGKWVQKTRTQYSYMLSRPDVQRPFVNWALRYEHSQAAVNAMIKAKRPPLFDPHAISGLKPHQRPHV
ncbi:MAG: hypothetical protein RIT26_1705 [Pseudomonadota bacterium]